MSNEIAPFYVGQIVVGCHKHYGSRIKNGQRYRIRVVHYSPSGNPISNGKYFWYVGVEEWPEHDWMTPKLFAPIEENFQSISLEKVLEEETPFISAN